MRNSAQATPEEVFYIKTMKGFNLGIIWELGSQRVKIAVLGGRIVSIESLYTSCYHAMCKLARPVV